MTDQEKLTEACEILRNLRSQASQHYDTLNNWLIIDAMTDALELIRQAQVEVVA